MDNDRRTGEAAERRSNLRVPDQVLLDYEPLDEQEAALRRQGLEEAVPEAFAVASELHELRQDTVVLRRRAEQESSVIARLLDVLDRKLDRVAEVLMIHELGSRRPERADVDIGSDGMGFVVRQPLPVGTILDMRMILPSSGLGLRTFARVVHCGEDRDGTVRVGVHFEYLRKHDGELMAHHVLQREAIMLRDRNQQA